MAGLVHPSGPNKGLDQQARCPPARWTDQDHYLNIATARYQTGLDPYLNVMTAQLTLLGNQQTQATLRINEMTAAVELIQALGGGWNTSKLPTAAKVTASETPAAVSHVP